MSNSQRKMTPKGQMSQSANSGPAIMMMPPHIRATFMPNPPLRHIPPTKPKRNQPWNGMAEYMVQFEKRPSGPPVVQQPTPRQLREAKQRKQKQVHQAKLEPRIQAYRKHQRDCGGEYEGMNCYNTLFVGRLAYEVTERKLLREMETYGPVKDIRLIKYETENKKGKGERNEQSSASASTKRSRGYAFVEFEHEEDMKRAFRAADGMRLEGREIVVDVERGHTVPNWLPRRLGGGLGGTRLGGKDKNVTFPGRFDPSRPEASRPSSMMMGGGPPSGGGMGRGSRGPPPPHYGGGGRPPPYNDGYGGGGGPPPPYGGGGGPYGSRGRSGGDRYGGGDPYGPPPRGGRDWDRGGGGGGGYSDRKRHRSRSPDRRHGSRRRY